VEDLDLVRIDGHRNCALMKVLITGNLGYVGPVVVRHLRRTHPKARLIGFDSAFFALSTTGATVLPERFLDEQHFGDVREIPESLLEGLDAVIHLAAVSNDPMGNKFERVTEDVNYRTRRRYRDKGHKMRFWVAIRATDGGRLAIPDGTVRDDSHRGRPSGLFNFACRRNSLSWR
jgi:hypothetical protein